MYIFLNALIFQVCWWLCVLSVKNNFEITALLVCALLSAIQLLRSQHQSKDLKLLALALPAGILLDTLFQQLGMIDFYGWSLGSLSPFWLWMIWIQFLLTIHHSLQFLKNLSWALVALLGFIFGPVSYISGATLGAASNNFTLSQTAVLALTWAVILPSVIFLSKSTEKITKRIGFK
jgi:hypothetical protein